MCYWGVFMKKFEIVLIKIIIIQFVFLFLTQLVFHKWEVPPQLKQITKYEGVGKNEFTEFLQAFKNDK